MLKMLNYALGYDNSREFEEYYKKKKEEEKREDMNRQHALYHHLNYTKYLNNINKRKKD